MAVGGCGFPLAIVLVEVDGAVDAHTLARFPRLFGAGAEGTRGMLEAIASAMRPHIVDEAYHPRRRQLSLELVAAD